MTRFGQGACGFGKVEMLSCCKNEFSALPSCPQFVESEYINQRADKREKLGQGLRASPPVQFQYTQRESRAERTLLPVFLAWQ